MIDKYLRRLSFLLFSVISLTVSAQNKNLSPLSNSSINFQLPGQDINDVGQENVNKMKLDGKLTGNEKFTNRAAHPQQQMRIPSTITPTMSSTSCNCWIPRDATFQIAQMDGSGGSGGPGVPPDYRNDDWSTNAIALPFNLCFYGTSVNTVFLNNNGNVSIGASYATFTANSFPDPNFVMIAPFWADVDTRGPLSGLVYYSVTPTHMIVQWDHVGYFNAHDTLLCTFQLIITDGTDPIINPGQNVSFCYQDMQWTTGDASSGTNGFGGTPATVGVNRGNGVDYIQFGLFDQSGSVYDGPFGLNDGVDWLDNQSFTVNACISSANIPPVLNGLSVCDTMRICENTTTSFVANYLSPELGQTTHINYFAPAFPGLTLVQNTVGPTATIEFSIVANSASVGFHTITITAIDDGTPAASTTNTFVIEVVPAPLPSFTYSPASPVQTNTTVTFTNTSPPGSLLTWDFGDASPTSTLPNPTHAYTTAGTYTITLSAFYPATGCTTVITQQITITSCTPATFTINNVCTDALSTVTYTGSASPAAVYAWDFNGGSVLSGAGSGPYSVSWNTPGTYSVSLTVTEPTCSSQVSMPVNVNAVPVSSITPLAALCAGDSPSVNFDGTAGPGATYTWNFGTATVISGSGSGPYNLQWNAAGNDQVTLIVSENGCSDTSQIAALINPIPTANFTLPLTACANDILSVNYTGSASAAANYNWNFNGANIISGSGQGSYSIDWTSGGIFNVDLTVTENGCISPPFSLAINITPIPVVSISPVSALCAGQSSNVNFTGAAGVGAVYNWNFGSATVLSGVGSGPYNLQWITPGIDHVQLSVDENGCTAQTQIDVTVFEIPTSDFVVNNAACIGEPVNLNYTGTATSAANYNWTFTSGTVSSGTGQGPYSVVWNTQGVYVLSLVVTENGCVSPQTDIQATVNPLPFVNAGNYQLVCSGTPVPLGDVFVPGSIYSWTPTTNLSDPTISDPVATPVNNSSATRDDAYILNVIDANGCANIDTVLVGSYPVPVIDFNPLSAQCIKDNNFLFNAFGNIPSGVNYSWTFSSQANPVSSLQSSVSVVYSAVGTFPVLLTADYNGCPAQPRIDSVTIYEMPTSDFFPLVFEGCEPLHVPFSNTSTGNNNTYSWSFGDGTNDITENPDHTFQHAGLYSVSLQAVNKHGCAVDTLYTNLIEVFPMPTGQFIPNPQTANILAPVIQFQNYSINAQYYSWEFGDSDTSLTWSPSHTYSDTGNYEVTLMLMSPHGCLDTIKGIVRVEDNFSFYIPSAFTPNGDGVNDQFRGYGVAINNYLMNIYDRWGELIYTTNNYDKPWDGRLKTGLVQTDVYVYRIALTDQHDAEHIYVGDVSVIR